MVISCGSFLSFSFPLELQHTHHKLIGFFSLIQSMFLGPCLCRVMDADRFLRVWEVACLRQNSSWAFRRGWSVRAVLRTPSSVPENSSDSLGVTASRAPMFVAELIHTVELRLPVCWGGRGHGIQYGTRWCQLVRRKSLQAPIPGAPINGPYVTCVSRHLLQVWSQRGLPRSSDSHTLCSRFLGPPCLYANLPQGS